MAKHTIVLEWDDAQQTPSYSASMSILGGKVTAVQFSDALEAYSDLERQLEQALDALDEAAEHISQDNSRFWNLCKIARGES